MIERFYGALLRGVALSCASGRENERNILFIDKEQLMGYPKKVSRDV